MEDNNEVPSRSSLLSMPNTPYTPEQESDAGFISNFKDWFTASGTLAVGSLLDIPDSVSNLFRSEDNQIDTPDYEQRVLDYAGQDALDYYKANKGLVDASAFIGSAIVPGLGGVKLLNVGQDIYKAKALAAGGLPEDLGWMAGLAANNTSELAAAARASTALGDDAFRARATLGMVGQQALEAAAFEVSVAATLEQSPILSEMDFNDTMENALVGVAVGTGVGSIFGGFGLYKTVKEGFKEGAQLENAFKPVYTVEGDPAAQAVESVIKYNEISGINIPELVATSHIAGNAANAEKLTGVLSKSRTRALDEYRNTMTSKMFEAGHDKATVEWMNAALESGRFATQTPEQVTDLFNSFAMSSGSKRIYIGEAMGDGGIATAKGNSAFKYLDLANGDISVTAPTSKSFTLGNIGDVAIQGNKVTAGKRSWTVDTNPQYNYDIALRTTEEIAAKDAVLWEKVKNVADAKRLVKDSSIYEFDRPMLSAMERVWAKGADDAMQLSVRQADGNVKSFGSFKDYKDWFDTHRLGKLADRVSGNTLKDMLGETAEDVEASLMRITGVRFSKEGQFAKDTNAYYNPATKTAHVNINGIRSRYPKSWQTEIFRVIDHEVLGHAIDDTVTGLRLADTFKQVFAKNPTEYELINRELGKLSRKARPGHWLQARKDTKMAEYLASDPELVADARQQLALMTDDQRAAYPKLMSYMGTSLFGRSKEYKQLLDASKPISPAEVIAKLDTDGAAALEGNVALPSAAEALATKAGFAGKNPYTVPSHMRIQYDTTRVDTFAKMLGVEAGNLNSVVASAVLEVAATKSRELRDAASNAVFTEIDPEFITKAMPTEVALGKQLEKALPDTAGQTGMLTASSPAYNSLAESAKFIGSVVNKMLGLASNKTATEFTGVAAILRANPAVARGWASVNNFLLGTPEKYVLSDEGTGLVSKSFKDLRTKMAETEQAYQAAERGSADERKFAKALAKHQEAMDSLTKRGIKEEISLKDFLPTATADASADLLTTVIKTHVASNARKLEQRSALHQAASGNSDMMLGHADAIYPIQYQTNYYMHAYLKGKHVELPDGFVDDFGEGGMIYANSAKELKQIETELEGKYPGVFSFKTPTDIKAYKESWQEYSFGKAITESTFDSTMKREGLTRAVVMPSDPEVILSNLLKYHENAERSLVRRATTVKYQSIYESLDKLSKSHTAYETAQRSGAFSLKKLRESVDPWTKLANESLDISSRHELKWFKQVNDGIDNVVSAVYNATIGAKANAAKEVSAEELAEIGAQVHKAGFVMPTAGMLRAANATYETQVATKAVNALNGALSFLALRSDFYNAFNNYIAHPIMYAPAIRALIEDTAKASPEFAKLVKLEFGGNGFTNAARLYKKAMAETTGEAGADYRKLYQELGFDMHLANQYQDITEDIAKAIGKGDNEAIIAGSTKLANFVKSAETVTGNKLAESKTRLISARTAHIIAEHAVKAGALDPSNVYPFINNFVNKVHGTYLASQRPHLFQGALGQSMGLFLTYMFNMTQQFTKYMVDGNKGSAKMMAAMQGSIYGMNGMPAFAAFNTSIVGSAAGNTSNQDIYSAVYQGFGADAADWIMYGMGSNLLGLIHEDLKSNMYTRGDLNPRQMTVIPTSIEEVPVYGAMTKFVGNAVRTVGNAYAGLTSEADGAFAGALLTGLEHNGLNRPVAGLGRVLQGFTNEEGLSYSTDNKYHVQAAWDMYSLASVTQMLGAKPLVEARVTDAMYRAKTYDSYYNAEIAAAKEKALLQMRYGTFEGEAFDELQDLYLSKGHTVQQWNRLLKDLAKDATQSNLNKLIDKNTSSASQQLVKFMNGYAGEGTGMRFQDVSGMNNAQE